MASASSSTAQVSTPVHSHPLLADETPSRGRRARVVSRQPETPSADTINAAPTQNYFTLRERLDANAQAGSRHTHANWDGSVRAYGKADRAHTTSGTRDTSANRQPLPTVWDHPQERPPMFVVGSSKDHPAANNTARTAELVAIDGLLPGCRATRTTPRCACCRLPCTTSQKLGEKWKKVCACSRRRSTLADSAPTS